MKDYIKWIRTLSKPKKQRIKKVLQQLLSGDRTGLDIKPLKGTPYQRVRTGNKRIIFLENDGKIEIVGGGSRGDVYKKRGK